MRARLWFHGVDLRQRLAGNSQRLLGPRGNLLIMRVDHAVLLGNQLRGALALGERLRIGGLAVVEGLALDSEEPRVAAADDQQNRGQDRESDQVDRHEGGIPENDLPERKVRQRAGHLRLGCPKRHHVLFQYALFRTEPSEQKPVSNSSNH